MTQAGSIGPHSGIAKQDCPSSRNPQVSIKATSLPPVGLTRNAGSLFDSGTKAAIPQFLITFVDTIRVLPSSSSYEL